MMNSLALHQPLFHGTTTTKCDEDDDVGRKLLDVLNSRERLLVRFASKSSRTNVVGLDNGSSNKVHQQTSPLNNDANDAANDEEYEINALEHEITTRLQTLNITLRRRGLFNEDESRAARFYERVMERSFSSSSSSSSTTTTTNIATDDKLLNETKRKRKKSGGGGGGNNNNNNGNTGTMPASSYGIYLDSIHTSSNDGGGGESSYYNNNQQSRDLKEGLVLTALCKILGVYVGRKKKVDNNGKDDDNDSMTDQNSSSSSSSGNTNHSSITTSSSMMMTCAALDALCSLCDHAKDGRKNTDECAASIEGDMISSIGPYLLDALVENIHTFFRNMSNNKTIALHGLLGCFKACISVITLLTVRLSRGGGGGTTAKTIQTLRNTTWQVVTSLMNQNNNSDDDNNDDITSSISRNVQHAAITLLATLPLTGVSSSSADGSGSGSTPPSKIWSRCIVEGITLLNWAIDGFFPMMSGLNDGNNNKMRSIVTTTTTTSLSTDDTERLKEEHRLWVNLAKEEPTSFSYNNSNNNNNSLLDLGNTNTTDNHRAYSFLYRIQCLSRYIHSLLLMECYPLPNNRMNNSTTNHYIVPIDDLIDISEILLSFTLMAETRQYMTKSRLRSTPVVDGLISPNIAMVISPKIRLLGHTLLNVLMESCHGGYGILGKARRIVSIVCTNLHSSCSNVLVSVVDGSMRRGGGGSSNRLMTTSSSSSSSKVGSWLRGSIPLRIKSIYTFHVMVIALGSGIMSSTSTAKSMSKALVLLGGCLLEQIQGMMDDGNNVVASSIMSNGVDEEWGTLGEKAKIVEVSSMALAASIAAFGGLIPAHVRGTIDSITHTCLTALYLRGSSSILAYSNVKRALLQLGMNCVCVPWGDGGRSTLAGVLRTVSTMLRRDPDVSVASAALSTLCVFDSFMTPRSPPILIPTRGGMMSETVNENGGSGLTASSLMQDINQAKLALAASKDAQDDKKIKKSANKKSNKKAKKEDVEVVDTKAPFESLKTAQCNSNSTEMLDVCIGVSPIVTNATSESVVVVNSATSSGLDSLHVTDASDIASKLPSSSSNTIDDHKNEVLNKMNDSQPGDESGVSKDEVYVPQKDKEEDDSDDDSMDDFPEIVDEEPDEEDRMR